MDKSSPYPPVSPPRPVDPRRERAVTEGPAYHWHPWHDNRWLCESATGALYLVGPDGCSCADWHHRCQSTDRKCKHQLALGHRLASQGSALLVLGMALLDEEPET